MTDYSKYNYYNPDGAGRDKYIIHDNGGQLRGGVRCLEDKKSYPKVMKNRIYHSLRKEIPPVTYYSDGTGRDGYIMKNSGGMKKDLPPLNCFNLGDVLRKYEKMPYDVEENYKDADVPHVDKFYWTKNEDKYMKKIRNTEGNLMKRLYFNDRSVTNNLNQLRNSKVKCSPVRIDYNTRIEQLDKSLDVKSILKEINKTTLINEKKNMLKRILKNHYFSQGKTSK